VPASAQSVLLDAAADFVDDLGSEPDHVKGAKHGDRVGQPVMNSELSALVAQPTALVVSTIRVVRLGEGLGRTQWLWAAPNPHQPPQQGDPGQARRIVQHSNPTAMADCEHATGRAGGLHLARLDSQH
jgi:hypothetical protein